jgi:hypothetical protein
MVRRRLLLVLACCVAVLATAVPARADVVDDSPAIAAQGAGDMRAFIRGSDGALWTRSWNGTTWTGWSSLGGTLTSGPSASARPGGIYDVVVRGTENAYYHRAFTPAGGWTEWAALGGTFSSAPGVSYRQGTGQIDVTGVGVDSQLYFMSYEPGTGWAGWSPLGGGLVGKPSVISPGAQQIEIYARGTDTQLYEKYWTPATGWGAYLPLGGGLSPGVAATTWDANRRDVFARGLDGEMRIISWTNTGGWGAWAPLGAAPTSGPGATAIGPNRLDVLARDGQQVIANGFASTWSGWHGFGYAPLFSPPPPPAVVPGPTPGSSLQLNAGFGCIPQGGRVPVRIRIEQRSARLKPRVVKVVFFIDRGKRRRTDRHAPYKTRMRVTFKRGSKHRVHARIYFRRKGHHQVQRKTVSKRFTMCR